MNRPISGQLCEYYLDEDTGRIVEMPCQVPGDLRVIEGGLENTDGRTEEAPEGTLEDERQQIEKLLANG